MSHSERIQEAAKEIFETVYSTFAKEAGLAEINKSLTEGFAAIISKHIPEQNERYWINRIYNAAVDIDLGNKEALDEIKSLCRRSLATPSEPLGVTKEKK